MSRNTDDPQHWRNRAAQLRALAATITDSNTVTLMTDLAADYEKLAERAARKNKVPQSPSSEQREPSREQRK